VVEVSAVVDEKDVDWAARRAELFRRAGYPALPVVAGSEVTEGSVAAAQDRGVVMVDDGRGRFWGAALAKWPL